MDIYKTPETSLINVNEERNIALPLKKLLWGMYWRYFVALLISFFLAGWVLQLVEFERDPTNVKLLPSIIACFHIVTLSTFLVFKRQGLPFLIRGAALGLPSQSWFFFNLFLIVSLAIMAGANIFVAFNFYEDTWVKYKLFGSTLLGLTLPLISGILALKCSEVNLTKVST